MQDAYGRSVTINENEQTGECTYSIRNHSFTLEQRDDEQALEILAAFDPPPPAVMDDAHGRQVTVTRNEETGAVTYERDGCAITFDARDDARALDQLAMVDAPPPAFDLARSQALSIARIDAEADAVREAVLGGRATEYQEAYEQARAYAAAGYAGTVPDDVASWLTAKNAFGAAWTPRQAADDILGTGAAWLHAQSLIRGARLYRKEQIRAAIDADGIHAAMVAWDGFMQQLRAQLGV